MREKKSILLGWRSPAAWSRVPCEGEECVQVQNVDAWVSCWILRLWSGHCATDSRVARVFVVGVILWIFCGRSAQPANCFLCAFQVTLCGLVVLGVWSESSCMTSFPSRHCKLLTRIITCFDVSFNVSCFSACNRVKIDPQVQKDFLFALCS